MTEKELVLDTINYYKDHPERRGYNDKEDSCVYRSDEGQMCAVGRWIDEEKLNSLGLKFDEINEAGDLADLNTFLSYKNLNLKDILKNEVLEIHEHCWSDLQFYHDVNLDSELNSPEKFLIKKYKLDIQ